MTPKTVHIKRKRYSNSHKLEIAKLAQEPGNNVSSIARAEGLPESTVRTWLKDFERLDSHVKSHGELKTIHKDKIPTLTTLLRTFCEDTKTSIPPRSLTSQTVSNRAAAIAIDLLKEYEQNDTIMEESEAVALKKMVFSTSWAVEWAKRNDFMNKRVKREPDVPLIDLSQAFKTEVSHYEPENMYCLTDPMLFFRVLPRNEYVTKVDNVAKTTNSMKLKDRITLYLCTNATGTHKIPLAMIGNAKNPRVLGKDNRKELFKYYSQEKTWSDAKTYKKWFDEVFLPYIRSVTAAKILLIVPFISDDVIDEHKQVKCIAFPNTSSSNITFHGPLSMGVISNVKRVYRYNLLNEILFDFENREVQRNESSKMIAGTAGLAEGREPHILNVMEMLDDAWKNMDMTCITMSWIKSGLLLDNNDINNNDLHTTTTRNPITEQLRAAIDSVLFGLKNLELPEDNTNDDPLVDNVRSTLKLYKSMTEENFVKELETWVLLEETDSVLDILKQERDECLSAEEEKYCDTIKMIQNALSDTRYSTAVEYLQRARNEILRSVKYKRTSSNIKKEPEIML